MTANRLSLNTVFSDAKDDDFIICTDKDKTYSKRQLKQAVYKLYQYLKDRGSIKEVAICTKNSYYFDIAFFACLYARKTPVLLGNFTDKSLIEDKDRYDALILDTPQKDNDKDITEDFFDCINNAVTFKTLCLNDNCSIILYTSGSTGNSKRIVKTLKQMEHEANLLKDTFNLNDLSNDIKVLSTVPPYHMYGLTFRVFMPLFNHFTFGANLTHYTEELCNESGDILLISSPAFIKRIDVNIKAPSIIKVFSAGAPLQKDVAKSFYNWTGIAVTEIYGSTETNVIAYKQNTGDDSDFTPFDGISFYKDNDENTILKSPMIDGDFKLDDRLTFNDCGHFVIEGRKDRIIKLEEKRVSLTQIETLSKESLHVLDAVALPVEKRNRVFIGLVLQVDKDFYKSIDDCIRHDFVKDLKSHLKDYLPNIAIPRYIRIVDMIETNSMGKKITSRLQELFND